MNEDTPVSVASAVKEGVTPSVVDMTVEMEKISSLEDTIVLRSFPPLSTPVTTTAGNAPGKSSYSNVTCKPSGKKLNIRILFTPRGNGIDVVFSMESIRAISERFANTAYSFFLGKRVAYHVVANYGRSSYDRVMIELRADVELKDYIVVAMSLDIFMRNVRRIQVLGEEDSEEAYTTIVLNPIIDKIGKFEELITSEQAILVDEAGNPLKKVEFPGDYDSEDEVSSVDNDMARSMASERVDPYDDDMYEGQDLPQELQTICDNLDIRVRGHKKK
ncbi:hypothetical protein Tco_0470666 [Tanacetum coccineum]